MRRWFSQRDEAYGWLSRQFKTEAQLQNAISAILGANKIAHNREAKSKSGKSRADFLVGDPKTKEGCLYIEAKVETKSTAFDRAIGQALRNAVCGFFRTWIVIPDDVKVKEDHVRSLYAIGGEIVRISDLDKHLVGLSAYSKEIRDFGFLDQWEASIAKTKNREVMEARKIEKAIPKRFPGVTPEQKQKEAEENERSLHFMAGLLNSMGNSSLFYVGERGITVRTSAKQSEAA
jgi:hypothetical protein